MNVEGFRNHSNDSVRFKVCELHHLRADALARTCEGRWGLTGPWLSLPADFAPIERVDAFDLNESRMKEHEGFDEIVGSE